MLECGLGGKLDATNIVDAPEVVCSAIVSIGLDHMDVIGNSLEEIAEEKAGVIKHDVPCVLGPTCQNMNSIREKIENTKPKEAIFVPKQETFTQDNNQVVLEILKIVYNFENIP